MRKQLTVALGLAVLATPAAYASKARLLALGEDTNGSFFINDNRNIFLNSAEVNNHKDLVTFEFGSGTAVDGDTSPNAEGGVLKGHGSMVYGIHLGRETSFENFSQPVTTTYSPSNAIDLFVGGDTGIKWGANLTWQKGEDDAFNNGLGVTDAESNVLDLNVGMLMGDLGAYLKAGLQGKTEYNSAATPAAAGEVERKSEYEIGAAYKIVDYTIFAQVNMSEYDSELAGAGTDNKTQAYNLGAARFQKIDDRTAAFVKLAVQFFNDEEKTAGAKDKSNGTLVPVSIGLEHDATSWLILRGSVSQNLWSKVENKPAGGPNTKNTIANSTNVNAGATLKFGELSVDGVIGTSNGTNGGIVNTDSEVGVLSLDNLMTRASVTYRF